MVCGRKPNPPYRAPLINFVPSEPLQLVFADITELPMTSKGNRYILVIIDHFTKYVNMYAMPDQTALTVAKIIFEKYVTQHGIPERIHTDQGRQFESILIHSLCSKLGIAKTCTTAYHPQADGLVERFNRTMKGQLARLITSFGGEWDNYLAQLEFPYNSSRHFSTGFTPYFLLHGRESKTPMSLLGQSDTHINYATPGDYVINLHNRMRHAFKAAKEFNDKARKSQKNEYDKRARMIKYSPGDLVWVDIPKNSRQKLAPKWEGPYIVLKVIFDKISNSLPIVYQLRNVKFPLKPLRNIHVNRLKPYRSPMSDEAVRDPGQYTALSGALPTAFPLLHTPVQVLENIARPPQDRAIYIEPAPPPNISQSGPRFRPTRSGRVPRRPRYLADYNVEIK